MTQPAHPSKAQRRLLMAGGGAGVAVLAAGAFVLSFDYLRALAVQGGAGRGHAYLYPGMLDGLVVVVILSILMSRRFRWWSRATRWLLLLVLIAGAAAAGVEHAVHGYGHLPRAWLSGGVAAAPWVILMLALWLWISMIKQARAAHGDQASLRASGGADLIPGLADEPNEPLASPPARLELEPAQADDPEPAARTLLPTDVPVAGLSLKDTPPEGIPANARDQDAAGPPSSTFRSSPLPPRGS